MVVDPERNIVHEGRRSPSRILGREMLARALDCWPAYRLQPSPRFLCDSVLWLLSGALMPDQRHKLLLQFRPVIIAKSDKRVARI